MPQQNIYIQAPNSGRHDMAIVHATNAGRLIEGLWNENVGDPSWELSIVIPSDYQNLFGDVNIDGVRFWFRYNGNDFTGDWLKIPVTAIFTNNIIQDQIQIFYVYLYKNENWWNPDGRLVIIESNQEIIDITAWGNEAPPPAQRKVHYTLTNIHDAEEIGNIIINSPEINGVRIFEENHVLPQADIADDITYEFEFTISPNVLSINDIETYDFHLFALGTTILNGGSYWSGHISQQILLHREQEYLSSDYFYSWNRDQSASAISIRDSIWNGYEVITEHRRGIMGIGTNYGDRINRTPGHDGDNNGTTFIPQKLCWLDYSREYEIIYAFCWSDINNSADYEIMFCQSQPTNLTDCVTIYPYYTDNYPERTRQAIERVNSIGLDHYIKFNWTRQDGYIIPNGNETKVKENHAKLCSFHRDFFYLLGASSVNFSLTAGRDGDDESFWNNHPENYTFSTKIKRTSEYSLRLDWPEFHGALEMKTKYPITITPNPVLQNTDVILVNISPPLNRYYWDCNRAIRGHAYFKCEIENLPEILANTQPESEYYFDWRKNIEELGDLQIPIFIKPELLPELAGRDITIKTTLCWKNPDADDPLALVQISIFRRKVKIGSATDGYWGTNAPAGENIQPPTWWDSTYVASGTRTTDFDFRKDMRNALFEVLDSSVRKWVIQYWDQFARLKGQLVENWSPAAFQSSERVRLIDTWATEILYNIESIFNFFGEAQVQSLYAGIYSHLQRFRSELGNLVDETVNTSIDNLNEIQELLLRLQRKVDEETILSYEMSLPTVPLNQIKVFLVKGDSDRYWDVTDKLFEIDGQLMIDLDQLKQTIESSNKSNYFKQWYLKIVPTGAEILDYQSTNQKTLSANIEESDINILGASLIDNNSKVYKIVNKSSNGEWILSESIDENEIDKPLTIIYNYFEPQILELKFSWWHNYIPEDIPFGIELPELDVIEEEIIEEEVIEEQETVEKGESPNINKEIF